MNATYNPVATANPDQPNDRIENLRHILEKERGRAVTYDEARGIGQSLIRFFKALADD